jgi:hypothetical protein
MILFGSETPDPDVDFFHIISWHCEIKADYPDVLLNSECCCETEARCLEFCLNATLNFGPKDFDRSQLRPKSTQQGNDATPSSSSPGFPAVALAPFPTPCRLAAPRRTAHSSRSGGGTGGGRSRGCLTGVPRPAGPVGGKIVTTRQILTERGTAHLRSSSPFCSNRSPPFVDLLGEVTRKIRMGPLNTREILTRSKTVSERMEGDNEFLKRWHQLQKFESIYTCLCAPFYRETKGFLHS